MDMVATMGHGERHKGRSSLSKMRSRKDGSGANSAAKRSSHHPKDRKSIAVLIVSNGVRSSGVRRGKRKVQKMADKEQMKAMREQGLKYREIAEACGVSKQYVATVCGKYSPAHFVPIGEECIYPNLRKWMNENKVTRVEFLRRMGYTPHNQNYYQFNRCIWGQKYPRKNYIDKMLQVTGLTYEELFAEVEDGK